MNQENGSLLSRVGARVIGVEAYKKARNAGEKKSIATIDSVFQIAAPLTKYSIESSRGPIGTVVGMMAPPVEIISHIAIPLGLMLSMEPSLAIPAISLIAKGLYNAGVGFFAEI